MMKTPIIVCFSVAVVFIGSITERVTGKILKRGITCTGGKCACRNVGLFDSEGYWFCCDRPPSKQRIPDHAVEDGVSHAAILEYCGYKRPCFAFCNDTDPWDTNQSYSGYCFENEVVTTTTTTTTTTTAPPGPSCFPSTAGVNLQSGKSVTMSELQVGDQVLAVSSSGRLTYSTVRAFLKKQHSMTSVYKSISTSSNDTITLSGNHLIYARKNCIDKFNQVYADEVSCGDDVLVNGSNELIPVKVTSTSSNQLQGAYVPLTTEGNIMVDGVLASCYPSADHVLVHFGMTPIQWFPGLTQCMFGQDNGFQGYVKVIQDIARWVLPYGIMYERGDVLMP